jgi:hypothetical protein
MGAAVEMNGIKLRGKCVGSSLQKVHEEQFQVWLDPEDAWGQVTRALLRSVFSKMALIKQMATKCHDSWSHMLTLPNPVKGTVRLFPRNTSSFVTGSNWAMCSSLDQAP